MRERDQLIVNIVAKRIKALRIERKLTQKQIAQKIGISLPTYNRWERGKVNFRTKHILPLLYALNVTADELLGRASDYREIIQSYKKHSAA